MKLLFTALSILISISLSAQSTFENVYNLLQTNCTSSGCHSGSTPAGLLDFSGTPTEVFNALLEVDPTNPTALDKGNKLVDAGYPRRSFLFRKINNGLDLGASLELSEGNSMPNGLPPMNEADIELVRQWILAGAPETGSVIDYALLDDFYNNEMGKAKIPVPSAPAPSEGFQIYNGPIFLAPGEEKEYLRKYKLNLPENTEITRLELIMNDESHHFILYEYNGPSSGTEGFQLVDGLFDVAEVFIGAKPIGVWQYDAVLELPSGTAIFWDPGTIVNLNYHVPNIYPDSIMAAEVYLNVYTQESGTAQAQMFADLFTYGGAAGNPYILQVLNNGEDTTFSEVASIPGSDETWYFWNLQGHTHKLGVDFDIFLQNSDGTRGDQVYEGFYNSDYSFNQGYWDYAHPPVRIFDPLQPVNVGSGLLMEATYNNDGPSQVGFGLTTADEMFVAYYQYTKSLPTGIQVPVMPGSQLTVFPSPFSESFKIQFNLEKAASVEIEIYDLAGRLVSFDRPGFLPSGFHVVSPIIPKEMPDNGIFMLRLKLDGSVSDTKKIVRIR